MEYPHYDYAVLGGDMRQVFLAEELAHHQMKVCHYALTAVPDEQHCSDAAVVDAAASLKEACENADCIVGPLPFTQNGSGLIQADTGYQFLLSSLLALLKPGQTLFAGGIPADFKKAAKEKGVAVFDFLDDASLAVRNSIATAEGAVCEAILRSPVNLHQSRCAVLGFGKCGHTLVSYLKGMFCNVCVGTDVPAEYARASVIADDCIRLKDLSKRAGEFDFLFNTIPAPVVDYDVLHNMKRTALIIDIASAPGGVDYSAASRFKIPAAHCLGLPGKYAPSSSAKILFEIIQKSVVGRDLP